MNATTYGLDVAKLVFQMYWVDAQSGEITNRRFRRDELIVFLAQRPAGRVALEACGSAHWWARKIKALGHEVVLLHPTFIRPFVQTNKTDAADARAIWTAVQQPEIRRQSSSPSMPGISRSLMTTSTSLFWNSRHASSPVLADSNSCFRRRIWISSISREEASSSAIRTRMAWAVQR